MVAHRQWMFLLFSFSLSQISSQLFIKVFWEPSILTFPSSSFLTVSQLCCSSWQFEFSFKNTSEDFVTKNGEVDKKEKMQPDKLMLLLKDSVRSRYSISTYREHHFGILADAVRNEDSVGYFATGTSSGRRTLRSMKSPCGCGLLSLLKIKGD